MPPRASGSKQSVESLRREFGEIVQSAAATRSGHVTGVQEGELQLSEQSLVEGGVRGIERKQLARGTENESASKAKVESRFSRCSR